jgi:hypothetical protein
MTPYLSPDLPRHIASLFSHAELQLIDDAGHWPQWDQPQAVAAASGRRRNHGSNTAMSYVERLVASDVAVCGDGAPNGAAAVPDACVDLIWAGERQLSAP